MQIHQTIPVIERTLRKVPHRPDGGCWIWRGSLVRGRGQISVGSRSDGTRTQVKAYRVMYEHFVGPIPVGMTINHLCENPACVNPQHLEAITLKENIRYSMKNSCLRGHIFTLENIYLFRGIRHCRACRYLRKHRKDGLFISLTR